MDAYFDKKKILINFKRLIRNHVKKSVIAALLLFLACGFPARSETIPGADGRITYIGRTATDGGDVSFDWTGVYMKVRFQGSSLSINMSDTKKDYYNVWLDKEMDEVPDKVLAFHGSDTTVILFSAAELKSRFGKDRKAAGAPHQVILQKRTEGEQGTTIVHGFTTDGSFLQADRPRDRIIEYIGDSYTCGYGTEASNKERFSPETENQNLTYACETARYFDADQIVIAHSGMGIARNYNSNVAGWYMPERYLQTFDKVREADWDAKSSSLKPDITVIYLGTNDFSTRMQPAERIFIQNYILLLKEIKEFYGDGHPILCMASKHDVLLGTYILKAIETSGLTDVHFLGLSHSVHNETTDMGADGHPNYPGHTKIAYAVIPCVSTITGWEMSANTIK